jgi:hypothetical protein
VIESKFLGLRGIGPKVFEAFRRVFGADQLAGVQQ